MLACRDVTDEGSPPHVRRMRVGLADGAVTTVHVASYPLGRTRVRVARLPADAPLEAWCGTDGVADALGGGFFVRQPQTPTDPALRGMPLGELWIGGVEQQTMAFEPPWHERRGCVHLHHRDGPRIARRDRLGPLDGGDLLQAGPVLVEDGRLAGWADEGFSAGAGQFDQDITVGRHPRAAVALTPDAILAVASDGRTVGEAGLTLEELAATLIDLGAHAALNLDGGGSTSLVCAGRLRNQPRSAEGELLAGGRPVPTALVFEPLDAAP